MSSVSEQILQAIRDRLQAALPMATIKRNRTRPVAVDPGGLLILRDGEPGEPEELLGGEGPYFYSHRAVLEVYARHEDDAVREALFDTLLLAIDVTLSADPFLGGLAQGLSYGRPAAEVEGIEGEADIKAATLDLTVDYQSLSRLG
jgi:hypothetical protein